MILALLSLLLSGAVAFTLLIAFFALVPRVATGRSSVMSFALQWFLMALVVAPAIAVAYFGPGWLYEAVFGRFTTKDQRFWLIVGGIAIFAVCFVTALRSAVGKRYSQWRAQVA